MKWKNGRTVLSLALVAIVQTTDLSAADVRFDDLLHRPIARMHPSGCRDAEFSFEAPAPGWYVLYAHPGRNGFFLTGCDAPICFSLGKTRGFDPTMPCIALGVE